MSEFILREEGFNLGILDKMEIPVAGTCFLLYQTGVESGMVINQGIQYSSTKIRHAHYNCKVTLSLEEKSIVCKQQLTMQQEEFHFDVTVKIAYRLQNAERYFFKERLEEADIMCEVRKVIRKYDGEWDVKQSLKAQSELEDAIMRRLSQYDSIKFKIQEIGVKPDEAAIKMLQSDRDKVVGIHVNENETDEKIAQNKQSERVLDSENGLKMKKIQDLAMMMKNFGILAPIVEKYFKDDMDGTELFNYIAKMQSNDLRILTTAVDNDLITQQKAFEKLNSILSNDSFMHIGDQLQLQEKKEDEKADEEENKDEEENEDEEEISVADGVYI